MPYTSPIERVYIPKHFKIFELVPPRVYKRYGNRAWKFLDSRLLWTIDQLRKVHGPMTVNDWFWGGYFKESGFREPDTKTGATFSAHKFGRAIDLKPRNVKIQYIYDWILMAIETGRQEVKYITRIEDISKTPSWLHLETSNSFKVHQEELEKGESVIRTFYP